MTLPEVTFTIPFWSKNEKEGHFYLRRTLESLLAQRKKDWQAIVVDDACEFTSTKDLLSSLNDSRIRYHRGEVNLGQSNNWNRCKSLVETAFYAILHADDELHPNYLERMLYHLKENPHVDAVFCEADIIDENSKKIWSFVDFVKNSLFTPHIDKLVEGEDGLASLLQGNFIMCPTVMFRTSSTQTIAYDNKWLYIPDLYYWCRMMLEGKALMGLPEKLFYYRRHQSSITGVYTKTTKIFAEEHEFYDLMRKESLSKGWDKAARVAQQKRIVKLRSGFFAMKDILRGDLESASEKIKFIRKLTTKVS